MLCQDRGIPYEATRLAAYAECRKLAPPSVTTGGAFSFVPAGLTAHIQYGAGSTSPQRLMGATPTTGTKLKAPPVSEFPDGAFFCLIQTS